jgi:hypothetical protein
MSASCGSSATASIKGSWSWPAPSSMLTSAIACNLNDCDLELRWRLNRAPLDVQPAAQRSRLKYRPDAAQGKASVGFPPRWSAWAPALTKGLRLHLCFIVSIQPQCDSIATDMHYLPRDQEHPAVRLIQHNWHTSYKHATCTMWKHRQVWRKHTHAASVRPQGLEAARHLHSTNVLLLPIQSLRSYLTHVLPTLPAYPSAPITRSLQYPHSHGTNTCWYTQTLLQQKARCSQAFHCHTPSTLSTCLIQQGRGGACLHCLKLQL